MAWMKTRERNVAQAIADLIHCNPFLPERIELERRALGRRFVAADSDWNRRSEQAELSVNVERLVELARELLTSLRKRARQGSPTDAEAELYQDVVLFLLYHEFRGQLDALAQAPAGPEERVTFFGAFESEAAGWLRPVLGRAWTRDEAAHLLASFFQIRRAFGRIFHNIAGISRPAALLRAAVWQSIFTHDMRRYRRVLFDRMGDFPTLITGPSGSGKELVAQAVGLARHIPFDPRRRCFTEDFVGAFFAVNVTALSPTVIESELFGHRKGSFTGAVSDRVGWLEVCPPLGAVFLDEVGELEASVQVKLLRVLQSRTFSRLGETRPRQFTGKLITATNRDLQQGIARGTLREDFYYRLCADRVQTPSLRERLDDEPAELAYLVEHLCVRLVGPDEGKALAREAVGWIERHLGAGYAWPGNVRELEQCVRGILIRRSYDPGERPSAGPAARLAAEFAEAQLPAEAVLVRYCTLVYARTGSYEAAARQLGLDRRTVRRKVDPELLREMRGED